MKLLALLVLSLWSNVAQATPPGQFTFLGVNQCAPFEGVLFDPPATANLLADFQFAKTSCDAAIQFELNKQKAEYDLEIENLNIRYDSLQTEYRLTIESLNRENDALSEALRKQSKKNPALWIAVGVASGIAMTYAAHEVFGE